VCREAGMQALRRDLDHGVVEWADIAAAHRRVSGFRGAK
jgi:ATP-dependent 26S proteasome regulatory subunit